MSIDKILQNYITSVKQDGKETENNLDADLKRLLDGTGGYYIHNSEKSAPSASAEPCTSKPQQQAQAGQDEEPQLPKNAEQIVAEAFSPKTELEELGIIPMTGTDFLAKELPPHKWIIRDFIAIGMKGDLCGSSKTFKTFFAQQLAISVAGGIDFLGKFKIEEPHRVAYFNLELFPVDFQGRMRAQCEALSMGAKQLDNLIVCNLRGKEECLREYADTFIKHLKDLYVELVIIDPRYKLIAPGEDENTADGLRPILELRDKFSAHFATMLVTHNPKGDTANKKITDQGAGSYTAGADFDFRLTIDRADTWAKPDNLKYVIDSEGRARPTPPPFGVIFDGNTQTFTADETIAPIKLGTRITTTTNPTIKAEREKQAQKEYIQAAEDTINEYASKNSEAPLMDMETFNTEIAKKQGAAALGIHKRDQLRKALVNQGIILATCKELYRNTATGEVKNKKNGKTFISSPGLITAYRKTFDSLDL